MRDAGARAPRKKRTQAPPRVSRHQQEQRSRDELHESGEGLARVDPVKEDITSRKPHQIVAKGIARTFQNIRLFANLTCRENVMAGRHCRATSGLVAALVRTRGQVEEERLIREAAEKRLLQVGLWESRDELARNIPYGRQGMLEIARPVATSPRMLDLDEPSSGLNPRETEDLMAFIRGIIRDEHLDRVLHRARHECRDGHLRLGHRHGRREEDRGGPSSPDLP